jgi:cytoskeletal protein CcmA (bactofilin family)
MLGALSRPSNARRCGAIDTLIGAVVEVKGDIVFSGGLRIDGKVKGNITAKDATGSLLILGEHAEVHGNVNVPHMVINGKIKGNVRCEACIELQGQAEITGDVHYGTIAIAHGAAINGALVHRSQETAKKGVVTTFKPATSPPGATW